MTLSLRVATLWVNWHSGPLHRAATISLKSCYVFVLVQFLCLRAGQAGPAGQAGSEEDKTFKFVSLPMEQRGAALKQLADADLLNEQWSRLDVEERKAQWGDGLRARVIEHYEELIATYPKTKFGAIALSNLMAVHTQSDDMTRTEATYKRMVKAFPQSRYEMDAHMHMGLTYLQKLKQSRKAAEYFKRIGDPRKGNYQWMQPGDGLRKKDSETFTEADSYYVNGRLHLVKAYLLRREFENVKQEIEDLRARYPEAREWVEKTVRAFNVDVFGIPPAHEVAELSEDLPSGLERANNQKELVDVDSSEMTADSTRKSSTEKDDQQGRVPEKEEIKEVPDTMMSRRIIGYIIMGAGFVGAGILEIIRRRQERSCPSDR